ncbi:hypothetical protein YBT1520_01730 [Bacillus thuringiensis serovar kurstaki str. YBT-1520]|nr:hypothetical protein YBT1520_01730 [Bacillus thuringiensis serovar kurstaki str. YBT-1520]
MKSGKTDSETIPPLKYFNLFRGTRHRGGGRFFKFRTKFARYIKLENDVNQKGGILWLEGSVKQ